MRVPMIFRFSLYGFLKNQQYYDPFLILVFREKGLSFFQIGLLIGFRELAVTLMEVPTGVIADLCGRRRSMMLSFAAYILSFILFATSTALWQLFAAMFLFAIGEAFRTGTHKAMILDWLRLQGREDEKTKTYGYTRSWSKMGSAVSVIIAAGLVFYTGRYSDIFWFTIIPYVFGIINFVGYPAELDGRPESPPSVRNMVAHLRAAFHQAVLDSRLRRVLVEGMGFESMCKVTKDYLQPVLKQAAIALPLCLALGERKRTAILVGAVYFVLYLVSSVASRKAHTFAGRFGGESRAARRVWLIAVGVFLVVAVSLWVGELWPAVVGFVVLELVRNFWRPITITRVDNEIGPTMGATMLSIESQAKAAGAMILAPLIGLGVDRLAGSPGQPALWVVGVAGLGIALAGALTPTMKPAPAESSRP